VLHRAPRGSLPRGVRVPPAGADLPRLRAGPQRPLRALRGPALARCHRRGRPPRLPLLAPLPPAPLHRDGGRPPGPIAAAEPRLDGALPTTHGADLLRTFRIWWRRDGDPAPR